MENGLLTTAEAAKRMKRSRRWVQNLILRGKLKAELMGGVYVVRLEDVRRYRHQPGGRPALKKPTRRAKSPKRSAKKATNGTGPRLTNQTNQR